jgi:Family of unknown function (DUF5946)
MMPSIPCPQCGATFLHEGDSCVSRFEVLLSLDHSRQQPWGNRHGQAFAAFALQHPAIYPQSLDHAWAALYQIYAAQADPAYVFTTLRAIGDSALPGSWTVPPRPTQRPSVPTVTIADLADFAADAYPGQLDAWCRASLVSWGLSFPRGPA